MISESIAASNLLIFSLGNFFFCETNTFIEWPCCVCICSHVVLAHKLVLPCMSRYLVPSGARIPPHTHVAQQPNHLHNNQLVRTASGTAKLTSQQFCVQWQLWLNSGLSRVKLNKSSTNVKCVCVTQCLLMPMLLAEEREQRNRVGS